MERRFEVRRKELLAEAEVKPRICEGLLDRLERFVEPFAELLARREQGEHAVDFVSGLLSDLKRKNSESIAYRHDQGRKELQHFIGQSEWDHQPLLVELSRQVGEQLGRADGVLVFDPSGFAKKGAHSVGVQRQWCGRVGKVENCQVGIYLGYVSSEEHALVNMRLFLPREWAQDRQRRKECHVPRGIRFQTRHALCLEMLAEVGHWLPHAWITGDDELGKSGGFRRDLSRLGEQYLLAIPSNYRVRVLEGPATCDATADDGPHRKPPFQRVDRLRASLPAEAWTKIEVRDGEKGPLRVELVKFRVQIKSQGRNAGEETLVISRRQDEAGSVTHDYYFSNAPLQTELTEFARAAKAEHRIEDCLKRGKSEAGLADYEVRSWPGWHHHQTLSLLAAWFLTQETRREKKIDTRHDLSPTPGPHRQVAARRVALRLTPPYRLGGHPAPPTESACQVPSLQTTQPLGPLTVRATAELEQ
jgi:SRSO17 transposase